MGGDLAAMLAEVGGLHEQISARQRRSYSELPELLATAQETFARMARRLADNRDDEARQFNVFRLTNRAHFEVTTHQTVLADLLNPIGLHGQGNLFLKPFLGLVTERTGIVLPAPDGLWEVDHGLEYIDVRLRHPSTRDAVVIETKWDAPDTPGQVVRYWKNELKRTAKARIPVVFLTKDGREPDLGSRCEEHSRFEKDLVRVSYRLEFAEVLRSALRDVKAPRVRETLAQYLELLDALETIEEGEQEQ
jgi:hypothetical protein